MLFPQYQWAQDNEPRRDLARLASEQPEHFEACAAAFAAIVRRARLRKTSAALRVVRAQDGPVLAAFWEKARGTKRATRRRP
jgi:hypothetical protein